jgi:hypothetical protein
VLTWLDKVLNKAAYTGNKKILPPAWLNILKNGSPGGSGLCWH